MHHFRSLFWTTLLSLVAAGPATAPSDASPPRTGDIVLNFTQRSPLSSRKEMARRLTCKESELGDDYDLTTFPFNAYIPPNYDPSTPFGVFVLLANKDVNCVAASWEPLFDKSHMIYITPQYRVMQGWQLAGLGLDAIDNLKRHYNIDTHRVYVMWSTLLNMQLPILCADVYSGMVLVGNCGYFRNIIVSGNRYMPAQFSRPPADLLRKAKSHGFILLDLDQSDPGVQPLAGALKEDGFAHVLTIGVTAHDLHFATFTAGWITDPGLPFLDKAAQENPGTPSDSANAASVSPSPTDTAAAPPTTRPSRAQHLLSMAQLFIANGKTELARTNLQDILSNYPDDPAAVQARKLLDSLPAPPPPQ
jgi:hypothetical protein